MASNQLEDILEEYGYAIVNHPEASRASHIRTYKQAVEAYISKHYISREAVEEAIGEDEKDFGFMTNTEYDVQVRNQFRSELRNKLLKGEGSETAS